MFKKFIITGLMFLGLTGLVLAATEYQEDGTKVNKSDKVNFKYGPNVTANGAVTDLDFSDMTGPMSINASATNAALQVGTGTPTWAGISTTNDTYVAGDLEVDGRCYLDGLIYDTALYGAAAGVGAAKQLWVSVDGKIYAP